MTVPVWSFIIVRGIHAYGARERFAAGAPSQGGPVWCYSRFGQSITKLPIGGAAHLS